MTTYAKLGLLLAAVLALAVLAGSGSSTYAWTAPAALATNTATGWGDDYDPQVTTDGGGDWLTVWRSWDTLGGTIGTDEDIQVARSTDNDTNGPSVILLIINIDVYDQISASILTFMQDLSNEGYATEVALATENTMPTEIKDLIASYYSTTSLAGVVLIGNIKSPYFVCHTGDYSDPNAIIAWLSLDAIDMYYMDMDGQWEESDKPLPLCSNHPPNVVACYEYPSCTDFEGEYVVSLDQEKEWDYRQIENKEQYKIEIWVSRIMAHNLDIPGKNETDILNDYFAWNHAYRTGQHDVSDKAYILNSGPGYNDQGMDYSDIFGDVIKQENVHENDYLGYLGDPDGSRLLYLTAHSTPRVHSLYGSSLTTDELLNAEKNSVLYLLNACSACRWDNYISYPQGPNYLGGLYVFGKTHTSGDYGLGAIGFAGVGGFNNLKYFTDYLNSTENATYGGAFKYWFNENLMINFGPHNYVFLGDPTIMPTVNIRCGDVDCDDDVDAVDALFILQYVVGARQASDQCPPPEGHLYLPAADVDCDNDMDAVDALFVLQYVVGLRPELCVCPAS